MKIKILIIITIMATALVFNYISYNNLTGSCRAMSANLEMNEAFIVCDNIFNTRAVTSPETIKKEWKRLFKIYNID